MNAHAESRPARIAIAAVCTFLSTQAVDSLFASWADDPFAETNLLAPLG